MAGAEVWVGAEVGGRRAQLGQLTRLKRHRGIFKKEVRRCFMEEEEASVVEEVEDLDFGDTLHPGPLSVGGEEGYPGVATL